MLQQMRSRSLWIWFIVFFCFVVGFLLADTSGLLGLGGQAITPSTAVAKVNGVEVPYITWQTAAQNLAAQEEQQRGRSLTLDERAQIEDQAFEQLVTSILMDQEYAKRGIRVSDDEIRQAAVQNPPPPLVQSPDFQTDGRFDIEKYRRFLNSAAARQQGILVQLENYYRTELPRTKLYDQLASDVFVSDEKLWSAYKDQTDSAQVSFVAFEAPGVPDSAIKIPESELREYFNKNKDSFERPGRAVLSVLSIPRTITAADTQATRAKALALRDEINKGAKFEDVARRESSDSSSAANGGSLGMRKASEYVKSFGDAALALKIGQLSEPVVSEFGIHLIKKEAQKGDSINVRHILLRVTQADSSATRTDRRADSLSRMAGGLLAEPKKLDSASQVLKLPIEHVTVFEGQPALSEAGAPIPSVSAWAFGGPKIGETSDLFDSEQMYTLARLDTIVVGGIPTFEEAKDDVRRTLLARKKAESLRARAQEFASSVQGNDLEGAARAKDLIVQKSELFTRPQFVNGLGRFTEAVGAAFTLPVGVVSAPIITNGGAYVMRVDRRIEADRAKWETLKEAQRLEAINAVRQNRVRAFLQDLRKSAKVTDNRKKLNSVARRQADAQ